MFGGCVEGDIAICQRDGVLTLAELETTTSARGSRAVTICSHSVRGDR